MQLSDRLQMVISLVEPGSVVADVGTDHGFVAIDLVERGVCKKVLAMDVRKGPLSRAIEHVDQAGLNDKITCRLSDGLQKYEPGEADTILIAGMGGDLMVRILTEGLEKIRDCKLVLSPHAEWEKVRAFLLANHYTIRREKMVCEEGKYYVAIQAFPGEEEPYSQVELLYGKQLLNQKNPVLLSYLNLQEEKTKLLVEKLDAQASEHALAAKERMEKDMDIIRKAKEWYI